MSTEIMPWRVDGKPRESQEFDPNAKMRGEGSLHTAFFETFTEREMTELIKENKTILIGFYINPNNRSVSEVSFNMDKDPYAALITPDKIYQLEKLLKKYVTFDTEEWTRKYNYVAMTTLYKFKFTWNYTHQRSDAYPVSKLSINEMYIGYKYTYDEMVAKLGSPTGSRTYTGTGEKANFNFTEYRYGNSLFVFENSPWGNKFVEFTLNDSGFILWERLISFSVGTMKIMGSIPYATFDLGGGRYKIVLGDGYLEVSIEGAPSNTQYRKVTSVRFVPTK